MNQFRVFWEGRNGNLELLLTKKIQQRTRNNLGRSQAIRKSPKGSQMPTIKIKLSIGIKMYNYVMALKSQDMIFREASAKYSKAKEQMNHYDLGQALEQRWRNSCKAANRQGRLKSTHCSLAAVYLTTQFC